MKKKKKIQVQGRDDEPTKKERKIQFRSRNETLQKEIPKSKPKFEVKPYKKKSRSSKRSPKAEVKALQKNSQDRSWKLKNLKKEKRNVSSRRFLKKKYNFFLKFRFENYTRKEKKVNKKNL